MKFEYLWVLWISILKNIRERLLLIFNKNFKLNSGKFSMYRDHNMEILSTFKNR